MYKQVNNENEIEIKHWCFPWSYGVAAGKKASNSAEAEYKSFSKDVVGSEKSEYNFED